MLTVHLSAVITEDHQLIVNLPPDLPPGQVQITIQTSEPVAPVNPDREAARAALAAAGLLGRAHVPPPDMKIPTDEEFEEARRASYNPNAKPMHEIIDEDRGER